MKRVILIGIAFLFVTVGHGQQISMYSQYMFNDFSINPAVAGSEAYAPVALSFRRQWAGMKDAPVTQTLSAHTFMGESMERVLPVQPTGSSPRAYASRQGKAIRVRHLVFR